VQREGRPSGTERGERGRGRGILTDREDRAGNRVEEQPDFIAWQSGKYTLPDRVRLNTRRQRTSESPHVTMESYSDHTGCFSTCAILFNVFGALYPPARCQLRSSKLHPVTHRSSSWCQGYDHGYGQSAQSVGTLIHCVHLINS
jgi:hypothetical protein